MRKIQKSILRIFMTMVICFLVLQIGKIRTTNSFFTDLESSTSNTFSAGSLDAEVSSSDTELQLPAVAGDMIAGDSVTRDAKIENVGTEDFQYNIAFEKISGDNALCAGLQLRADKDGGNVYDGNLGDFNEDIASLADGESDDWNFSIELPAGAGAGLENLNCEFKFVFTAWQTGFVTPAQGWVDTEEIAGNEINSGEWTNPDIVINEFLPNPEDSDGAAMPDGEWVELYNKDGDSFDLAGWRIYDNGSNFVEITLLNSDNDGNTSDGGETIIPGHGFLVVYLNGKYSGWLNNTTDEVRLFNGSSTSGDPIDSHSYDGVNWSDLTPTPGANNANDYTGSGNSTIPAGKSFVRYPDGSSNWIDPVPTPGEPNSDENSLKAFQEFYEPLCFDKKGEPICDIEFMYLIGLLEKNDKELAIEEVAEIPTEGNLMAEATSTDETSGDEENEKTVDDENLGNENKSGSETAAPVDASIDETIDETTIDPGATEGAGAEAEMGTGADTNTDAEVEGTNNQIDDGTTGQNLDAQNQEEADTIVEKEISLKIKGKPEVADGLEAEVDQKIKKITVSGTEEALKDLDEIKIDLSQLDKTDKADTIEIKIEDLDIPDGVEIVSDKDDEVVVEIKIEEKAEAKEEKADGAVVNDEEE